MIRVSLHDRIDCPECRGELKIRPELLGQEVTCRHCHATFRSPASGRPGVTRIDPVPSPAVRAPLTPWPSVDCPDCASSLESAERARAEADRLREEIGRAEVDRRGLRRALAEAEADRDRHRDLLEEQAGTRAELEAIREESRASMVQAAEAGARIEELLARLGESDRERDRLLVDRAEAIRERDRARGASEEGRALALSSARMLREAHGRWAADRRRWRSEAEALLSRTSDERRDSGRRLSEAVDAASLAESARRELEAQVARLSEELAGLQRERADRADPETPDTASIVADRDRLASEAGRLAGERDRLIEERDRLAGERDLLGDRLAEARADRDRIAAELDRREAEAGSPGREGGEGDPALEERLREAIERAESATRERDEAVGRFERFSRERSEAESDMLASFDRVTRELEAARVDRARSERTAQHLTATARQAEADRDRLEAELDEARRRLGSAEADHRAMLDRLEEVARRGSIPPDPAGEAPSKSPEADPGRPAFREDAEDGDDRPARPGPSGKADHAGFVDLALANWGGDDLS
ncbi:coiled-coil domain-containing protein [Tautonia plasticadhaerens]|uniref:hypothetical protein n=1 Tax=Tautonia plasticadhaerens TaxID=2527974 RepID=UPI0011A9E849|nr:hypothetical protein [Tautonia plasticadhaerens]